MPGLLSSDSGRFFGNILRDLATCGYDAEWDCIPAAAVGAPHRRDRVFLVAYADSLPRRSVAADASDGAREATLADYDGKRCEPERYGYATPCVFGRGSLPRPAEWWQTEPRVCRVSDELSEGLDGFDRVGESHSRPESSQQRSQEPDDVVRFLSYEMALATWQNALEGAGYLQGLWGACEEIGHVPEALSALPQIWRSLSDEEKAWIGLRISTGSPWCAEWPGVPRVSAGVPARVDRLRCLGNAVVPQVAEWIGRRIMEADASDDRC